MMEIETKNEEIQKKSMIEIKTNDENEGRKRNQFKNSK